MNAPFPTETILTRKWKILIIDDDEEDYIIARGMLGEAKNRKFDVFWADSYEAGRNALVSDQYSAVLVDYDLGPRSGIDLIREVNEWGYAVPLILFTGRGNYEVDLEAMEAGATLYLTKSEANPLLLERAIRYAVELKHREQSLRASEARERAKVAELNAVLDAAPAIIWITHDTGALEVEGNQAAHDFLRVPSGKNLSKSAPVDAPRNFRVFKDGRELLPEELPLQITAASGQPLWNYEEEVVFEDGDHAFLMGNVTPLLDHEGKPGGAVGAFINITERKQAEEALRQAHQKSIWLARFPDENPNPVARVSADGIILYCNLASTHLSGGNWQAGQPLAPFILPLFEQAMAQNHTVQADVRVSNRYYTFTIMPLPEENYANIYGTDITERMQAEQALKQAEEKFSKAFLYNPVGLAITRMSDGRYLEVNESFHQIVGYTPAEVIGHTVKDINLYVDPDRRVELVQRIKTQGRVRDFDIKIRTKSGSLRTILTSVDPIEIAGEACIIATFYDITERQETELALRESEARTRDFLENTHDSVIILDRDWRIQYANQNFVKILNTSIEELVGRIFWEAFPNYLGTPVEQHYREVMQQRNPVHFEMRGVYSSIWFDIRVFPTQDGIGVIAVDRSAEKMAQEELQSAYARLRFMVDSNIVGITIGESEGRLVEVNDYFLNLLGYTREDFEAGLVNWRGNTPPEHWNADEKSISEANERGIGSPYEKEYIRKDGSRVWVYLRHALMPNGLRAAFVLDISDRKRAEETLQRSEQEQRALVATLELERAKLAAAIDQIPVGICIGDTQGNVNSMNRAGLDLHDFSSEAEMFSRVENYLQEFELRFLDGRPIPLEEWPSSRALRGEFVQKYEVLLHNLQTGKDRFVAYSAAPVKNHEGETTLIVYTLQDLTERKQAESSLKHYAQELERSNKALQDFAFVASHDLQEPLRKILMFGNHLRQHLCDSPNQEAADYLGHMQSAAERMHKMINGLLQLSQVTIYGRQFTQIHLKPLVEEVVSDLEPRIRPVDGQVIIDDLPRVEADELQMRQLFQNLIGNAIKFHRPHLSPVVRVSGTVDRKIKPVMAEIRIHDNGIGFDPKYAERIFQPFQRLHGRSEYEGTGLGLAICQKIVEHHHGNIEVQSIPNQGTTFIILLPVNQIT